MADDGGDALDEIFARNQAYAREAPAGYHTKLNPLREKRFRRWIRDNNVPFDPDQKTADYDMRGFYKAYQAGDAKARSAVNANDGQLHYPDYWKTPYHESFSAESKWATGDAPRWNEQDQLVLRDGTVVFDERARAAQRRGETE